MPQRHMETRNIVYYSSRIVVECYPYDENDRANQFVRPDGRMLTDPPFDPAMIIGDGPMVPRKESRAEAEGGATEWPKALGMKRVVIVMRNFLHRLLLLRRYRRARAITRIDSKIIQLDVGMFRDRSRDRVVNLKDVSRYSAYCSEQRWSETDKQILS